MNTATALLNRLLARGKFRHLQVLLRLAELGSVQRTAEAIGLTQSTVTQTLAYLESLLEVKLFERHARGVRPTPAARDLLPIARQLMLGISEGADAVLAQRARGDGVVRLIGSATATHGLLATVLPQFIQLHTGIQVHLREAEGEDQLLAMVRGEVDLVVSRRPAVVPEGWVFSAVLEDRFAIVCRAEHPLAHMRPVQWAQLADATWLLLPAGLGARARFDALWAAHLERDPKVYPIITQSLAMLQRLMEDQDLLAVFPLNLVRPQLIRGTLVEIESDGDMTMAPIGLLQPVEQVGEAASCLSQFLRSALSLPRRGTESISRSS